MKRTIEKAALILCCLVSLMALLTGCGKAVKNEEEIKVDLQNHSGFYSDQDVTIQKLSIIKRQTQKEEKKDTVYVDVDISGDTVKGQLSYILSYNLYDKGWVLDNVSRYSEGTWEFSPLKGPEQKQGDAAINEKYSNMIFKDRIDSLETNSSQLFYYKTEEAKYANITDNYVVNFTFNTDTGLWESQKITKDTSEYDWDIAGTYYPDENSAVSNWYAEYTMEIGTPTGNSVPVRVYKGGSVCFDEVVTFQDLAFSKYGVEFNAYHDTQNRNDINDMHMKITTGFVGAVGALTRSGCEFIRK